MIRETDFRAATKNELPIASDVDGATLKKRAGA
jgi:hypothetical protein